MDTVYAQQGDTVDLICHRHYGRTAGITEEVLLANPGLADKGPILPIGTLVRLPVQAQQPVRTSIKLWD